MNLTSRTCLAATAGVLAIASSPALAQATEPAEATSPERASINYLDLTAHVGYSSNPLLRITNADGSTYGRLSARGVHAWNTETSSSSVSGFVEGTTYFNNYGLKSIFSLSGDTAHRLSERVSVYGSAGFSGDLAGQLSNRFLYTPPLPEVPDAGEPPPVTVEDPEIFSFSGRQYRLFGQAGASIATGESSRVGISGGAQRAIFTNSFFDDYTTYFGTVSYDRTLSERTTVGVNVGARQTEYDGSSDHSTIINPAVTVNTRLSEYWDASASVGVSFSSIDREASDDHSTNLSFRGSLCHTSETERLCGRVSRYAQNSARSSVVTTTSAGVDWFKRLDDVQTLQLSASVVRYVADAIANSNGRTHHYRAAGSYSRQINPRFSAGADVGVRALRSQGPDPKTDFSGSLFLRYRLGDLG